jgi:hypothetical protein
MSGDIANLKAVFNHGLGSMARRLVFGRSVRILTIMQSCASAAKLRAAGPFSLSASVPCPLPVPATSDRQSAVHLKPAGAPIR